MNIRAAIYDHDADLQQGSPEWLRARLGHCTASRVKDALSVLKNGAPAQAAEDYMLELVCERLTGTFTETFVSAAMQWGTEHEPEARELYSFSVSDVVQQVGILHHPTIDWFAASPDGLVGDEGLVEIKCPTSKKHIRWFIDGVVPEEHKLQMLAQMSCSGRNWCDFVSFDPRMPDHLRMFVVKYVPVDDDILQMEEKVQAFLDGVQAKYALLAGEA